MFRCANARLGLSITTKHAAVLRLTTAAGSGGWASINTSGHKMAELPSHPARFADGRTTMKHLVLSIALSALVALAVSTTAQAYYHHRHHHYWHHGGGGGYWNYYRVSWPGRGTSEQSFAPINAQRHHRTDPVKNCAVAAAPAASQHSPRSVAPL